MAGWRQAIELAMSDERDCDIDSALAVENRASEPRVASPDVVGLSE